MGKCVVVPIGPDNTMEGILEKVMAGSVFVDGEEFRHYVDREIYAEFRAIVGRVAGQAARPKADKHLSSSRYVSQSLSITPDGTKLLVTSSDDAGRYVTMLNLETGDGYEVAIPSSKNSSPNIIYLDNECLLLRNALNGSFFVDIRFSENALWLEHTIPSGNTIVADASFADNIITNRSARFGGCPVSPFANREKTVCFTTMQVYQSISRLTKFAYHKEDHTLTKEVGDPSSAGLGTYWGINTCEVDKDTILVLGTYRASGSRDTRGAKVLLYSVPDNKIKVALDFGTFTTSEGSSSFPKIIQSGPGRFFLCSWLENRGSSMSMCEVRVSGATVEKIRMVEGAGILGIAVYQDGEILWPDSASIYYTVDDLAAGKENKKSICSNERIEINGDGTLRYGTTSVAVPAQKTGGRLMFCTGQGGGNAVYLAKSKRLLTTLRKEP